MADAGRDGVDAPFISVELEGVAREYGTKQQQRPHPVRGVTSAMIAWMGMNAKM
jgi:hypothetical protein